MLVAVLILVGIVFLAAGALSAIWMIDKGGLKAATGTVGVAWPMIAAAFLGFSISREDILSYSSGDSVVIFLAGLAVAGIGFTAVVVFHAVEAGVQWVKQTF